MTHRPPFGVVVLAVLVVAIAIVSGGFAASAAGDAGETIGIEQVENEIDPDDVLLAIDLEDDGDAVWTIEYRARLETDDEEAAFDDLQADIESEPEAYTATFHDRMNATADDAANATGREMSITEMSIRAERTDLPREYGVVTYSFRWSNFAEVDADGRMVAGDAVDGLFLDDTSALRMSWPDGWERADAAPPPTELRDSSVVWQGPTSFSGGEPRLTLVSADDAGSDGTTGDGTGGNGVASDGNVSATTLGLLIVLLAFGLVAFAVRRGWAGPIGRFGSEEAARSDAEAVSERAVGNHPDAASTDADGEGDGAADGDAGVDESADGEDGDADDDAGPFGAGVDPDLLSNEEKVLRLIEANGGRMKQKRVAEELDWTAAKTSQVTKGLREDGDLKGFRLGRENVLALPEEDPR
ncbi:helix-turn-helix transcriptional regulator [Halorubrum sp. DTA98]|uniref:helix-turn-helix transcriptional regulator n=1 Tax=Halorubrum sp. DTA98 TaxID=3402163 RepID=UPI003AAD8CBF